MFTLTDNARKLVYEFEGCDLCPAWAGGASGVNLAIGYDFGYHKPSEIRGDWGPELTPGDLARILRVCGFRGDDARRMLPAVAGVAITAEVAHAVFEQCCVPRWATRMTTAYPGVLLLPPDAQGAIWSLVYNRGTYMTGDHRREMAAIKPLIASYATASVPNDQGLHPDSDDFIAEIAAQIRSMKRLWIGKGLDGLIRRREAEAVLIESCITKVA